MKVGHIRELIAEWEKAARIAAGKNHTAWSDACARAAELIIGDTATQLAGRGLQYPITSGTSGGRSVMPKRRIRELIAQWEKAARRYAGKNHTAWSDACAQIWAAELIIGDTAKDGYVQPTERIDFKESVE